MTTTEYKRIEVESFRMRFERESQGATSDSTPIISLASKSRSLDQILSELLIIDN